MYDFFLTHSNKRLKSFSPNILRYQFSNFLVSGLFAVLEAFVLYGTHAITEIKKEVLELIYCLK